MFKVREKSPYAVRIGNMESKPTLRLKKIYSESVLKRPYTKMPLAKRYWVYQWERLPVIPLLLMSASVGAAILQANYAFSWPRLLISTVLVSAYLLQIRFADEPKDFEHDNKFYPTRPVQRGVITLAELRRLRNAAIAIFFAAAIVTQSWTVIFLACLQQIYSLLTRKEFFMREWLRDHFFIYMFSHYFQLIILNWLALTILQVPESQKLTYLVFGLLLTAIVELVRKIHPDDNDRAGDTYSATLGKVRAIGLYMLFTSAAVIFSGWLLNRVDGDTMALVVVGFGFVFSLYASLRYLQASSKDNTKILQLSSLAFYFSCAFTIILGL